MRLLGWALALSLSASPSDANRLLQFKPQCDPIDVHTPCMRTCPDGEPRLTTPCHTPLQSLFLFIAAASGRVC